MVWVVGGPEQAGARREIRNDLLLVPDVVAGGDDIPRKRGLGVLTCDLLVINKVDLAPHVNVDLPRMIREANQVRSGRPVLETNCAKGDGVDQIVERIASEVLFDR